MGTPGYWDRNKQKVYEKPLHLVLDFYPVVRAPLRDYTGKIHFEIEIPHPRGGTVKRKFLKALFVDFEKEVKAIFLNALGTDNENLWLEFEKFVYVDVVA